MFLCSYAVHVTVVIGYMTACGDNSCSVTILLFFQLWQFIPIDNNTLGKRILSQIQPSSCYVNILCVSPCRFILPQLISTLGALTVVFTGDDLIGYNLVGPGSRV